MIRIIVNSEYEKEFSPRAGFFDRRRLGFSYVHVSKGNILTVDRGLAGRERKLNEATLHSEQKTCFSFFGFYYYYSGTSRWDLLHDVAV
jgi:hypothetical protein